MFVYLKISRKERKKQRDWNKKEFCWKWHRSSDLTSETEQDRPNQTGSWSWNQRFSCWNPLSKEWGGGWQRKEEKISVAKSKHASLGKRLSLPAPICSYLWMNNLDLLCCVQLSLFLEILYMVLYHFNSRNIFSCLYILYTCVLPGCFLKKLAKWCEFLVSLALKKTMCASWVLPTIY